MYPHSEEGEAEESGHSTSTSSPRPDGPGPREEAQLNEAPSLESTAILASDNDSLNATLGSPRLDSGRLTESDVANEGPPPRSSSDLPLLPGADIFDTDSVVADLEKYYEVTVKEEGSQRVGPTRPRHRALVSLYASTHDGGDIYPGPQPRRRIECFPPDVCSSDRQQAEPDVGFRTGVHAGPDQQCGHRTEKDRHDTVMYMQGRDDSETPTAQMQAMQHDDTFHAGDSGEPRSGHQLIDRRTPLSTSSARQPFLPDDFYQSCERGQADERSPRSRVWRPPTDGATSNALVPLQWAETLVKDSSLVASPPRPDQFPWLPAPMGEQSDLRDPRDMGTTQIAAEQDAHYARGSVPGHGDPIVESTSSFYATSTKRKHPFSGSPHRRSSEADMAGRRYRRRGWCDPDLETCSASPFYAELHVEEPIYTPYRWPQPTQSLVPEDPQVSSTRPKEEGDLSVVRQYCGCCETWYMATPHSCNGLPILSRLPDQLIKQETHEHPQTWDLT